MADIEVLENEILEETPPDVVETPPDPVEDMENIQEFPVDIPSDDEMEITGETEILPPVVEGDTVDVLEENLEDELEVVPEEVPEEVLEDLEEITVSDNSISDNSISSTGDGNASSVSYTANYITMAAEEEPNYFEWQKPFSEFTTSEMLLLCIFLLLLVEFVHKIFKGSHWFKG